MVVASVAVFLAHLGALTLLLDSWFRREKRPDLAERLRPLRPTSTADEAQDWLDSNR
jgi:hypothetical protein